jgi:hypothetical protein
MKCIWLRYSSLLILLYLTHTVNTMAFLPSANQDESDSLLNDKTARLIGKIYLLSDPMNDPNVLVCFVKEHPKYFKEDGLLVRCTRMLGTWMLDQKKSSLNRESILEVKNKLAECRISEEYAVDLLEKFQKSDIDLIDLGNELIWLSEVLPCLVRGDLKTYLCTQTTFRKDCRKLMSGYKCLHNSDPEVAEIITENIHCLQQLAADQVSLLAIISKL